MRASIAAATRLRSIGTQAIIPSNTLNQATPTPLRSFRRYLSSSSSNTAPRLKILPPQLIAEIKGKNNAKAVPFLTSSLSAQRSPTGISSDNTGPLSKEDLLAFERDGFIIKKQLFTRAEMDEVLAVALQDASLRKNALEVVDGTGRNSKLSLWNEAGSDIYGLTARCRRVVDSMEQLFGDEVYHWHSKLMQKEPLVGGAWEMHQDYGYWSQDGCMTPDLASCLIAINPATKANGCLQVLAGSHRMGRIDHGKVGGQTGANMDCVNYALKHLPLVFFEAAPGDALFFHSNVLHASAPNTSPTSRWSLICTYNTKSNNPIHESHHPFYTPIIKVPDADILLKGKGKGSNTNTVFLKPGQDKTADYIK